MKIEDIDFCLDGGTCVLFTDEGTFCIDHRFGGNTDGQIYCGRNLDESKPSPERKAEIIKAMKEYLANRQTPLYYYAIISHEIEQLEKG